MPTIIIALHLTCMACPKQYDAFLDGQQVGYLRLRHGRFTVEVPTVGGYIAYVAEDMDGDGRFTDDERPRYLQIAAQVIAASLDLVTDEAVAYVIQ